MDALDKLQFRRGDYVRAKSEVRERLEAAGSTHPLYGHVVNVGAQKKRLAIAQNTHNPGYFVAFADIPDPIWQRVETKPT